VQKLKRKNQKNDMSKSEKSFTLLELLIVIFILSISLGTMVFAIAKMVNYSSYNKSKFVAVYLAQEGIELVRNSRDNNWLSGQNWLQGFPDCPSSSPAIWCEIDYNDNVLTINNRYLKTDPVGRYFNYDTGSNTKYKRKIYLDKGTNQILATAEVFWFDNLGDHNYVLKEKLYNWK
jgi:type II secretory pathway pseudopilin PulG